MATTERQTQLLVEAYADQHASIGAGLLRLLLGLWLPFRWWGRPDMVNAYAAQSAVYVDAANEQARLLSRAYMQQMLAGVDAPPLQLPDPVFTYERGGTPIVEVYKRPARRVEQQIRRAVAAPQTAAVAAGPAEIAKVVEENLTKLVESDLAATARDEADKVMSASQTVIGYRRVIHPELSRTGTCGLCIVAADRFHTLGYLMPIHNGCKCSIAPITATSDPGLRLNREDLDALYEAASANAADLKRIRVAVREHGELGPILVREGDHFRDVAEVNANSRYQFTPFERMDKAGTRAMWSGMKEQSEKAIRALRDARRDGSTTVDIAGDGAPVPVADLDVAIDFHRALILRAARHGA